MTTPTSAKDEATARESTLLDIRLASALRAATEAQDTLMNAVRAALDESTAVEPAASVHSLARSQECLAHLLAALIESRGPIEAE